MVDGIPIAHHVFAGNRRDASTVPAVLKDLDERFGLGRVVFVGDRGMLTKATVSILRQRSQHYLLGANRRRSPEASRAIEQATGHWLDCPVGITASERANPPRTQVQEVPAHEPGLRTFVVRSEERLAFERTQRIKAMQRVRNELEALRQRVESGRLKAAHKIGAAAARILARNHGQRYYAWAYEDGAFRYFEHPVNLPREIALEGKYLIHTTDPHLAPVQAVQTYKQLSEAEAAFRNMKDVIEMRPVYHQTDTRVQAHIFVAALAFLLQSIIDRKLKAAGLDLSAPEALQALHAIRLVEFTDTRRNTRRCVTRVTRRTEDILRAIGISELDPPTPQNSPATTMWDKRTIRP